MITIISGTNRENNETIRVSNYYSKKLTEKGIENQVLDLCNLPDDFIYNGLYGKKNDAFFELVDKYVLDVDKMVIVSPEYNGSFPGVLKCFIEGWNPKKTPEKWAALVGVAAGRQGNSRGMDDLTNVLNYLQINVVPVKIPISQIYMQFDGQGDLKDVEINKLIDKQIGLLI
jgi:NAD(P)H-dependent FMN reductase